jgi:peptide/nickel transport system substrate-binding protein
LRKPNLAWRLIAILAVLMLVAAACGDDDEGTDETTTAAPAATTAAPSETTAAPSETTAAPSETTAAAAGYCDDGVEGTLLWAHEQEPSSWQYNDPEHQLSITSWLIQGMWDGLYGDTTALTFYPELLDGEGVLTLNDDGSVTVAYKLRAGLTWSDGVAFTPEDVKFTQELIMSTDADGEFDFLYSDRTGYDLVTEFRIISDTEFEIDLSAFFGGWKTLHQIVAPAHSFEGMTGAEVNEAWGNWVGKDGNNLPSTGPLVLVSWNPGVSVEMTRNDTYHGSVSPDAVNPGIACVSGMTMNVVPDTDAQINAMKAGEAHFIHPQPQLAFEDLVNDPRFVSAVAPGPIYEHWGLNLNNVHLSDSLVREAVAYAFDKAQVVEVLYERVFGEGLLAAEGLWNTFFMPNQQPYYEAHGTEYEGNNVDAAKAKLAEAGYTEGADGIFTHPDNGRLSLRVGTTGGNALRELQQQIIQQQFAAAGIEIVIDNVPGSAYFSEVPFSEASLACATSGGAEGDCTVWDITQFAWVGGPWPGGQVGAYRSDGFGPYGLLNAEYDAKADECDQTVDEAEQNACYLILDKYATTLEMGDDGLFMLPITQKPDAYIWDGDALVVGAASADTDSGGPLANMVDFKIKG